MKASVCILDSPWGVDRRRPSSKVAYLLILTILQWQYADARATNPKSIMLLFSVSSLAISLRVIRELTYFSGDRFSVNKISMSLGRVLSKTALYTSVGSYLALKGGSR